MKIRALRLREVGCFSEALAIEGLSGALDVLAGPNETGKSTLFRALDVLFRESYKTESQKLKDALVPYRGGAPLIEADVEIAGRLWRYRKQYFAGRMAELTALAGGEVLRNADAETRIAREIDLAGLPLVFVPQRASLDPLSPETTGRDLVLAAIEAEVAATAGGRRSEIVRKAVSTELGELVSLKQQKPRNVYKATIERVEQLEKNLADSEQQDRATEAHVTTLEALRGEAAALGVPALILARQERLTAIEQRLGEDERLARDLEIATERTRHLEQQAAAAAGAHASLVQAIEEVARLDREIAAATAERDALATDLRQAARDADAALDRRHVAEAGVAAFAARLDTAARQAEGQRLQARLDEAARADAEAQRQHALLAALRITEVASGRIEAESRDIAILEAQLAAAAPAVEINLEEGAAGKIAVDGMPLVASTRLAAAAPLAISVPGVARVLVSPADMASGDELRADLAAHRAALADLLAQADAADIHAARAQESMRRQADAALREARATLAALAPDGVEALRRALAAAATDGEMVETLSLADLRQALAETQDAQARAQQATEAAQERRADLTTRHAVAIARLEASAARRASLAAELAPIAEAPARRTTLEAAKSATRLAAADAADATLRLAQRRLPSDERQRLATEQLEIRSAEERTGQRLREIEREAARLAGLIEAQAEAGLGPEIDRLRGELSEARRRRDALTADVAGLTLLDRLLGEVAAESTGTYLAPVLTRLGPPLQALLGADGAALTDGLGLGGLIRQGRTEASERLSTGTREQIAVLVRLAFADILAAAGRPLPMLLDDALVYADDDRLAHMVGLLEKAAQRHQVILLTCRTRAMAQAGFKPLSLTPWRP